MTKVLDKGHIYSLNNRGAYPGMPPAHEVQTVHFVNREEGRESEGTTTQECLRMLIDRTRYCDACLPWSGNKLIVDHLRMALMLHEVRAMERKVEKGELQPEHMAVGPDGHFRLVESATMPSDYARKWPDTGTETGSLIPGQCAHKKRPHDPDHNPQMESELPSFLSKGLPGINVTPVYKETA